MHMMADLSKEKLNLHRIQCRVLLYGLSSFSAIMDAIFLYTTVAVFPMPPDVERGKGSSFDFSHSFVIMPSLLHFVSSVALSQGGIAVALAKGLNTRTSKMHIAYPFPKNSLLQCPVFLCLLSYV